MLEAAPDDFEDPAQVRRLIRDVKEVRMAKLRAGADVLDASGGVKMNGVGGMEVAEGRAFIGGVIDGLRFDHYIYDWKQRLTDVAGKLELPRNKLAVTARPKKGRMAMLEQLTMTKTCCNRNLI